MSWRGHAAGERATAEEGHYVIEPIEYVDPSPPLETSLFDDEKKLEELLALTISSILARTPQQRIKDVQESSTDQGNGGRKRKRWRPWSGRN
jgi:hypothetical protein